MLSFEFQYNIVFQNPSNCLQFMNMMGITENKCNVSGTNPIDRDSKCNKTGTWKQKLYQFLF